MELLGLSAELLLQVLGYLGSEFFAEDPDRLFLSRRWYCFARQIFRQQLHLSLLAMPKLSLYAQDQQVRSEIRRCARSIDIWVPSIDDWVLPVMSPSEDRFDDEYWNLLKAKVQELRRSFSDVIDILRGSYALRSFRIGGHPDSMYLAPTSFVSFVHTPTLASFLSFSHITSLELDIGYLPNDAQGGEESKIHFCRLINSLLPRLHRLRYRMATLCEALLMLPPDDSKLELEELIIHLGFFGGDGKLEGATPTSHCRTPIAEQLQVYVRSRLKKVVRRLKHPHIVGVTSYELDSNSKFYFDALTDTLMLLAPNAGPWDVNGMEEVESKRLYPDW